MLPEILTYLRDNDIPFNIQTGLLAILERHIFRTGHDEQAARRREADRLRKQEARLRKSADDQDTKEGSPRPPKEIIYNINKIPREAIILDLTGHRREVCGEQTRTVLDFSKHQKFALPDDWKPTAASEQLANHYGIDCAAEAARFRCWALAKNAVTANWDNQFQLWLHNGLPTGMRQRRAAGGRTALAASDGKTVFVEINSQQWKAWEKAAGKKPAMPNRSDGKTGWWFPSEWPPGPG